MANYSSLIATIDANIKANNNQEITGTVLNSVLNQMVSALGAGYQFKGVATPSTNPGSPDAKVFYVAAPGTYINFGNLVVPEATTGFLKWDSSWSLETIATGVADGSVTQAKLASALVTKLFASGYKFMGIAEPSDNPGTPNQNVFYLAGEGAYPNFGATEVGQGQLGVLKYDGDWEVEVLQGIGQILQMSYVSEDGLFFVDSNMNIGAKIVQDGFFAINSISYRVIS